MECGRRALIYCFRANSPGRFLSAQAAPRPHAKPAKTALPKPQTQRAKLGNVTLAAYDNYSPVSRVAVVYNSGSRCETDEQEGLIHVLRNAAGFGTERTSSFGIVRNIQQIGASITCHTNREQIMYVLECTRDQIDRGMEILTHIATFPAFKPWELKDGLSRLQFDLEYVQDQPHIQLYEALHKAAYRDTLGRSLYAPKHLIGTHNSDMLREFVNHHFVEGNATTVAVGLDLDKLQKVVKKFNFKSGDVVPTKKAIFHGGEVRINTRNPLVHAAIVTEGAAVGTKEAYALAVLQQILGAGSRIKYSQGAHSAKLAIAASQATNQPFGVACINANYSDSGLIGFHVISENKDIGKILKALLKECRGVGPSITEKEVEAAKYRAKAHFLMSSESSDYLLEQLSGPSMAGGEPGVVPKELEAVTLADVQAVAKKMTTGKPTVALVGNLANVPYREELL